MVVKMAWRFLGKSFVKSRNLSRSSSFCGVTANLKMVGLKVFIDWKV